MLVLAGLILTGMLIAAGVVANKIGWKMSGTMTPQIHRDGGLTPGRSPSGV